jgi:hypothetical protein
LRPQRCSGRSANPPPGRSRSFVVKEFRGQTGVSWSEFRGQTDLALSETTVHEPPAKAAAPSDHETPTTKLPSDHETPCVHTYRVDKRSVRHPLSSLLVSTINLAFPASLTFFHCF